MLFSCNYNHYEFSLVVVIFWDSFDNFLFFFMFCSVEQRRGTWKQTTNQIRLDKVFTLENMISLAMV